MADRPTIPLPASIAPPCGNPKAETGVLRRPCAALPGLFLPRIGVGGNPPANLCLTAADRPFPPWSESHELPQPARPAPPLDRRLLRDAAVRAGRRSRRRRFLRGTIPARRGGRGRAINGLRRRRRQRVRPQGRRRLGAAGHRRRAAVRHVRQSVGPLSPPRPRCRGRPAGRGPRRRPFQPGRHRRRLHAAGRRIRPGPRSRDDPRPEGSGGPHPARVHRPRPRPPESGRTIRHG